MDALEDHLQKQKVSGAKFFWHRLRSKAVSLHIDNDRPLKLLDIGAGIGLFGEYLKIHRPNVDYHFSELLDEPRKHLQQTFNKKNDATSLDHFRDFDIIVLMDVLEHQADDEYFFSQLLERIRPDALLILTLPALQMLWSKWDEVLGHYRRYHKGMLKDLLEQRKLRILELNYLFPEMFPFGLYRRLRDKQSQEQNPKDWEFPTLPDWLNHLFYAQSICFYHIRRLIPFGTSLIAACRLK